ncbi:symmetrical bis(5'-nucleosyl)-tetraphosphatase [Sessilibacter corallicola]|uniref:Bis(5'-nucleosyl)-tetraphosphatase, symmetrical n=1 Tax=Sessilibacter corallicola TaxID=2904075 RepID=A0ABQ0A547_9GAMM
MPTYAVGDLQGCLDPLLSLLREVNFCPEKDKLWLVGDLVNRGPQSLETLRYLYSIRHCVTSVLGNHDLHLIAIYYGKKKHSNSDTLMEIIEADDAQELINWMRSMPLFYWDESFQCGLVHAGLHPNWSLQEALSYSQEVEKVIQSDIAIEEFLNNMYGNSPDQWHSDLGGYTRLRVITNYFTRMRFCNANGKLQLADKGDPDHGPEGYEPWFTHYLANPNSVKLIFGHWAALEGKTGSHKVVGLDTGCVWGQEMTMYRLEDGATFTCSCANLGN